MIVWGGDYLNSGGRYCAVFAPSPTPTATPTPTRAQADVDPRPGRARLRCFARFRGEGSRVWLIRGVNGATTFTITVAFLCIAAAAPEVIFVSPCECQGFHGKNRWVAKTDLSAVPSDKSVIQSITPSQIYA